MKNILSAGLEKDHRDKLEKINKKKKGKGAWIGLRKRF